ncbi:MAG: hypothetical protein JSS79_10820 [Bacteroidetes bacterium]|nr:hypothetical protein [Bacteroidota bacterium]
MKYKPGVIDELKRKGFRFLVLMNQRSRLTVVPTTEPIRTTELNFLEYIQLNIDDREMLDFLTAVSSNQQMEVKVRTKVGITDVFRELIGEPI